MPRKSKAEVETAKMAEVVDRSIQERAQITAEIVAMISEACPNVMGYSTLEQLNALRWWVANTLIPSWQNHEPLQRENNQLTRRVEQLQSNNSLLQQGHDKLSAQVAEKLTIDAELREGLTMHMHELVQILSNASKIHAMLDLEHLSSLVAWTRRAMEDRKGATERINRLEEELSQRHLWGAQIEELVRVLSEASGIPAAGSLDGMKALVNWVRDIKDWGWTRAKHQADVLTTEVEQLRAELEEAQDLTRMLLRYWRLTRKKAIKKAAYLVRLDKAIEGGE